jgi:hypothetical protein
MVLSEGEQAILAADVAVVVRAETEGRVERAAVHVWVARGRNKGSRTGEGSEADGRRRRARWQRRGRARGRDNAGGGVGSPTWASAGSEDFEPGRPGAARHGAPRRLAMSAPAPRPSPPAPSSNASSRSAPSKVQQQQQMSGQGANYTAGMAQSGGGGVNHERFVAQVYLCAGAST